MNRHEGVSCDSCLKNNFHGSRYKCLVCFDYDLCESCYEAGVTNSRHTADHPMQCILTRADVDLFFGGESLPNPELPQSYTCPYCARMGFTELTLTDHVNSEHSEPTMEVICPLCAAMPGGDPNLMTDDFAAHLSLEHRNPSNGGGGGTSGSGGGGSGSDVSRGANSGGGGSAGGGSNSQGPRDLISFMDDSVSLRHNVRRIPHAAQLSTRGGQAGRPRRSMLHFSMFDSSGLNSLSPSGRESVDPIAELLCQLSGVRRSTGGGSGSTASTGTGTTNSAHSTPNQLQQLQMQLQHERQHVNAARQQMERLPRRQNHTTLLRECPNVTSATVAASASVTASNTSSNTGGSIMTGVGSNGGNHHMHSSSGQVYNLLPINQNASSGGTNNGTTGATPHHHLNNGGSSSASGSGQSAGQSQHQFLLTGLLEDELASMFNNVNLSEEEMHSRQMRALFTEELFMSMMYIDPDEALALFDAADERERLEAKAAEANANKYISS